MRKSIRFLICLLLIAGGHALIGNVVLRYLHEVSQDNVPAPTPMTGLVCELIALFPSGYLGLTNDTFQIAIGNVYLLPLANGLFWGTIVATIVVAIRR